MTMLGDLLTSVTSIAESVTKVALAPVVVVAEVADAMVKPIADGAQAVADEIHDLLE